MKRYRDRIVSGYFFYAQGVDVPEKAAVQIEAEKNYLQSSAINLKLRAPEIVGIPKMAGIEANLPQFDRAVDNIGYFNFFPDLDGMIRRVPLLARFGGLVYPNIDLLMLRVALGWPSLSATVGPEGVEEIVFGGHQINTDSTGAMLLNHYGPGKTFLHVSAAGVLEGKVDPSILEGAIVLVGVTAVGVYDYGLWMKITYFIFGVLLATLPVTLMRYIVEVRKRAFIHDAFSHYLSPDVVNELARHPEQLALGGEARIMTAMCSCCNSAAEAEQMFERLVNKYNDNPAKVLLARVRGYIQTPPEGDWDGVYLLENK